MRALPLAVVLGVGFLDAPRAARGLYLDLLAHADADGVLVLANGQTPERAAALASPGDDPAPLLSELVRVRAIDVQPDRIVLALDDLALEAAPEAEPDAPTETQLEAAPAPITLSKEDRKREQNRKRAKELRVRKRDARHANSVTRNAPSVTESVTRNAVVTLSLSSSGDGLAASIPTEATTTPEKKEESAHAKSVTVRDERDARNAPSVTERDAPTVTENVTPKPTAPAVQPLALTAPTAPKAKQLPAPQPKLPWSVAAMLDALAESSRGAIVTAPMDGAHAVPLTNVIRNLAAAALTLDDVRLVGEWAAAGAFAWMGTPPGVAWVAKGGNLTDAVGKARAWRDGGRRPVTSQGGARAPAYQPKPEIRLDGNESDTSPEAIERIMARKRERQEAERKAGGWR